MFVISFNIYLFIYFSVKYAIQSNDCDAFLNKQSILFYSKIVLIATDHNYTKKKKRFNTKLFIPFLKKRIRPRKIGERGSGWG